MVCWSRPSAKLEPHTTSTRSYRHKGDFSKRKHHTHLELWGHLVETSEGESEVGGCSRIDTIFPTLKTMDVPGQPAHITQIQTSHGNMTARDDTLKCDQRPPWQRLERRAEVRKTNLDFGSVRMYFFTG